MVIRYWAVIDETNGVVINSKVRGNSAKEVLKKYLAKDYIRKSGVNLEVMALHEFLKSPLA